MYGLVFFGEGFVEVVEVASAGVVEDFSTGTLDEDEGVFAADLVRCGLDCVARPM